MEQSGLCSEINTKHINTVWAEPTFFIVKPVGASNIQSVLKGKLTILQDLVAFIEHIDNRHIYSHDHTQLSWWMSWAGHVARMGERRCRYMSLVEKSEGKNHFEDPGVDGRIILRWKFMKWDGGIDWIYLVEVMERWRALVNAVVNFRFPYGVGNFLTGWELVRFSRRTVLHGVSK